MSDNLADNLSRPSQWIRIAYMAVLMVAAYIVSILATALIIAQALFSLITGKDNTNLRDFGSSLAIYLKQIVDFLTYNSEEKPFPFTPFPEPEVKRHAHPAEHIDNAKIDVGMDIDPNDPNRRDF